MSLLTNRQDVIAADHNFLKKYTHDLTSELFVFAIRNQNEQFLKFTLSKSLLGGAYFHHPRVQNEILEMMKTKAKTEFIMNILIFADFSNGWNQVILQDLITCIEEITDRDHE